MARNVLYVEKDGRSEFFGSPSTETKSANHLGMKKALAEQTKNQ